MATQAAEVMFCVQEVGQEAITLLQELPLVGVVCKTLLTLKDLIDAVKSNHEELENLLKLLDYVIRGTLRQRHRQKTSLEEGFKKLEELVEETKGIAQRCQKSGIRHWLSARRLSGDIEAIKAAVHSYMQGMNLVLNVSIHVSASYACASSSRSHRWGGELREIVWCS